MSAHTEAPTDAAVDAQLDAILRASGSALRHYSMHKTISDMRAALRSAVAALSLPDPSAAPVVPQWLPIESVPMDETVLLANFDARCLLTGAPHVWTATYATKFVRLDGGGPVDHEPMWMECSYAATNENGDPTHWAPLFTPPAPQQGEQSGQEGVQG